MKILEEKVDVEIKCSSCGRVLMSAKGVGVYDEGDFKLLLTGSEIDNIQFSSRDPENYVLVCPVCNLGYRIFCGGESSEREKAI